MLIFAFFINKAEARVIKFKGYSEVTKTLYMCEEVRLNQKTGKDYCYIAGKSMGVVTLYQSTGLFDQNGIEMYENDYVETPNVGQGIIRFGETKYLGGIETNWYGWFMQVGYNAYSFKNMNDRPKIEWSKIIK